MRPAKPSPARRRRYATRLPAPERREQLLAAALDVVGEHGYPGLTMEAVARRAGVTKPVVYESFANRDDVMQTLLAAEEERAVAELLEAIGPLPDLRRPFDLGEHLAQVVQRVLERIAARPRSYRLILLHVDGTPPEVRERIDAGRATLTARVETIFALALAEAELSADVELLALGVVALAENAATLLLRDPERFTPRRFDAMLRQLLGVLLPAPA